MSTKCYTIGAVTAMDKYTVIRVASPSGSQGMLKGLMMATSIPGTLHYNSSLCIYNSTLPAWQLDLIIMP